jgi:hypothetical protein
MSLLSFFVHTLDGGFGLGQFKDAAELSFTIPSVLAMTLGYKNLDTHSTWTWTLVLMVGWLDMD